jgi:acetyl esterase/lipase
MADPPFQKLLFKTVMSLPAPALRMMSGGSGVWLGGRTLDPRFQFIAHMARRQQAASNQPFSPQAIRAAVAQGLAPMQGAPEPGVSFQDRTLDGPRGPIPCRLYQPVHADPAAPVMIYAHFGGGMIGDLETCHTFCTILAHATRGPVLSVDYRLAPEHRFPAGLEDVLAAYRHVRDNPGLYGVTEGRVAIGGDSMGGNFAAVICQMLKAAGEPQPVLQLMIYPAVDMASESQSMTIYGDTYPLGRGVMQWFAANYIGAQDDPADPRLSPIKTSDLKGLAPAIIITAGFDPLVDQGEAYARRLKAAGAPVAYRCYDSLLHGFTAYGGAVPAADTACREIAGLVREGYEGRIN